MRARQKCGSRAHRRAFASTLLNAKMTIGTPYGLVDLTDTRTRRPLYDRKCTLSVPFGTGPEVSSAADFYPTVKAALRHESADLEEDRKCLRCD